MNKTEGQQRALPEWLLKNENYMPNGHKETFVNKSIMSLLKILSRVRMQVSFKYSKVRIHIPLKIVGTLLLMVELSLTRNFTFVLIVNIYLLMILSMMNTEKLIRILKVGVGVTLFTSVLMIPALLLGKSYRSIMIITKVFASMIAMGLLSYGTRWNELTKALKWFYVPNIFIFILDISIKYIYILGELCLEMLYALKMRMVGRNQKKYISLAAIAGTIFLQSKEMAEEMYYAMECRGFSGEYHHRNKEKLKWIDYIYLLVNIVFVVLYIYFGRMLS